MLLIHNLWSQKKANPQVSIIFRSLEMAQLPLSIKVLFKDIKCKIAKY